MPKLVATSESLRPLRSNHFRFNAEIAKSAENRRVFWRRGGDGGLDRQDAKRNSAIMLELLCAKPLRS